MNPLEELERLHKEATPEPWTAEDGRDDVLEYLTVWPIGQADDGREDRERLLGQLVLVAHAVEMRDQRLIALSRNIVPQVIELARASESLLSLIEIANSGMTVIPFEDEARVYDEIVARERAALDALLRVIESEVSK